MYEFLQQLNLHFLLSKDALLRYTDYIKLILNKSYLLHSRTPAHLKWKLKLFFHCNNHKYVNVYKYNWYMTCNRWWKMKRIKIYYSNIKKFKRYDTMEFSGFISKVDFVATVKLIIHLLNFNKTFTILRLKFQGIYVSFSRRKNWANHSSIIFSIL